MRNTLALQWIIHLYLVLICAVSSCSPHGGQQLFLYSEFKIILQKKAIESHES